MNKILFKVFAAISKSSYAMCFKKVSPLMFDNNFGRHGPIFKLLSPGDS